MKSQRDDRKQSSSTKPTNLQSIVPNSSPYQTKAFRKPKKLIKTFQLQKESIVMDQVAIKQQLRERIQKIETTRSLFEDQEEKQHREKILSFSPEKMYEVYKYMRNDEQFVHYLPLTDRIAERIGGNTLKINLAEVQKMKYQSQMSKLPLTQIQFKGSADYRSSYSMGFRPVLSKGVGKMVLSRSNTSIRENCNKGQSLSSIVLKPYQKTKQNRQKMLKKFPFKQYMTQSAENILHTPPQVGLYVSLGKKKRIMSKHSQERSKTISTSRT